MVVAGCRFFLFAVPCASLRFRVDPAAAKTENQTLQDFSSIQSARLISIFS
jgi:hypothetical protein